MCGKGLIDGITSHPITLGANAVTGNHVVNNVAPNANFASPLALSQAAAARAPTSMGARGVRAEDASLKSWLTGDSLLAPVLGASLPFPSLLEVLIHQLPMLLSPLRSGKGMGKGRG